MKKRIAVFSILLLAACATKKVDTGKKPLYEILTSQSYGGASIRFYEILSEPKEISMLQNDDHLKGKIKSDDMLTANFVVLNMGEKNSGGHSITVEDVKETADKIIITVKEEGPASGDMATMAITQPYTIVKINSKKPIEIK